MSCNPNNLENCDSDLAQIITQLNNSFIKYCDEEDNIFSKDCDEFYNKEIKLNDFVIKIAKEIKEKKYKEKLNEKCQSDKYIVNPICIKELSSITDINNDMYKYVKDKCNIQTRANNAEMCDKIYNATSDLNNSIINNITYDYSVFIYTIIFIIIISIGFVVFFFRPVSRKNKSL